MKAKKPYTARWGIFSRDYSTIQEAMERCNQAVMDNESCAAVVVTKKSEQINKNTFIGTETVIYKCLKPLL